MMTLWRRRFGCPLGIVVLALGGCNASVPRLMDLRASGSAQSAAAEHRRLAKSYEAQGRWVTALRDWRIVHALSPSEQRPVDEVQRLSQQIARLTRRRYREAVVARAKGDVASARLAALRALALQPDHREAMDLLRSLESAAIRTRLASAPKTSPRSVQPYALEDGETSAASKVTMHSPPKVAPAGPQALEAATPSGGTSTNVQLGLKSLSQGQSRKALRYFEAAKRLREAPQKELEKHIEEANRALAERHYRAGVAKFRASRYGEAAIEFKRALAFDPGHSKARLYLSSATKLRK